ncbi:MAG: hypothetical protein Q9195_005653 [Heterodermia aff. obscurata]
MARNRDMGSLYAKNMAHFGNGIAMYHPVSAVDMKPPCVGYLDANRRWNHLTNIEWEGDDRPDTRIYVPLEKVPQKMAELNIEWRPRTSLGVREYKVDAKGESPYVPPPRLVHLLNIAHCRLTYRDNLPAGAEAAIRYASKTKFGAVLIAQKPVTLTSYNDETLFRHWIRTNHAKLAQLHGVELSRYGLWLVTRTYTTPRASINAWEDKDKDANMSVKVKANMMGDLTGDVDWSEKSSDKDWAHYSSPQGVVAFFDGIHVPSFQWWFDGVKARIGLDVGIIRRQLSPNRAGLTAQGSWKPPPNVMPEKQTAPGADDAWAKQSPTNFTTRKDQQQSLLVEENTEPAAEDVWGSWSPLRPASPIHARSLSRGRVGSSSLRSSPRHASTPTTPSKNIDTERQRRKDTTDLTTRLSTASTAAGNEGIVSRDHAHDATEGVSPNKRLHELRRKTSSPSLRDSKHLSVSS